MARALKSLFVAALFFLAVNAYGGWKRQNVPTLSWLRDVYFLNANNGWIVGSDGTLLTTDDGGVSWVQTRKFTTDSILQIHFTNEHTGWILCERNRFSRGQKPISYLQKTEDGGKSWRPIEFDNAGRERIARMVFNSAGEGLAFGEGGVLYRLQNDGRSWRRSPNESHYLLLCGSYSDAGTGAIAGAAGTIMFTENNGVGWEKATLIGNPEVRINSVFFSSQRMAWAVGSDGAIFASTGGGRLWRNQPSGTTADLTDVYFLNTREGWAVGDNGIVLHTVNSGATWSQVYSGVRHRLERVTFTGKKGFAVGFGGTILSYNDDPQPQKQ